jgi:NAD(P)-dependent dehydrogenase (short-subunit alcohol dehydrogenase family)
MKMELFMLSSKVAIVTGASSGIGRAVALAFATDAYYPIDGGFLAR